MNEYDVYFDDYCPECKHSSKMIIEHPCDKCQAKPTNPKSHKPILFEEKEE